MTGAQQTWPRLDYATQQPPIETCHLVLQLIGKLPLRLLPWVNHGWHVALRITPRGYATQVMPGGDKGGGARHFTAELDVHDGNIVLACDNGARWARPIAGRTIAQLHGDLTELLHRAGLPAPLHGAPNEMAEAIAFDQDHRPRHWDPDAARDHHAAFLRADEVFNRFRAQYLGKSSPSHLFWGSFDLAVTCFSGREAPKHPGGVPNLPDAVTREAYSQEAISAGFWLGGPGSLQEAAFYSYAYPMPDALAQAAVEPTGAVWHEKLGEFVLPYALVARASDPASMLMDFLQSSYHAAARLLDWPSGLTVTPAMGAPPPQPQSSSQSPSSQ